MRKLLVCLKGKLCEIARGEKDLYDSSELEYLMNLIDGFLMGYLEINESNLEDFIESVVALAIMQVRFDLLDYVKPFQTGVLWENTVMK